LPSIERRRGTNANQAKNSRLKLGKERMRRAPERRLNKISFFFIFQILRNKRDIFKEDLNL